MSEAIKNLELAQRKGVAKRPKVGGFPYLAETLRCAGVTKNIWFLPSCQSLFLTSKGNVMVQGTPLITGTVEIPKFDSKSLIIALRNDQAGKTTFPEFLAASWQAGVVRYDVDFIKRSVTYYGCNDEKYIETYPYVNVD